MLLILVDMTPMKVALMPQGFSQTVEHLEWVQVAFLVQNFNYGIYLQTTS